MENERPLSRWPSAQDFGHHIRRLRYLLSLDVPALAERAELELGALTELEAGQRDPSYAELNALSHGLGIRLGTMFRLWEQGKLRQLG